MSPRVVPALRPVRINRFRNVIAVVEDVRAAHPELQQPMRWPMLARVLEREHIDTIRLPIRRRAYVQGGLGSFVITVQSGLSPRHYRRIVAHEYGHIKLHMSDSHEVVRQTFPCLRGDPRELEADLFAVLLILGPTATPDHPDVARIVAKLEAPRYMARIPEQLPLELPVAAPVLTPLPEPYVSEREYQRRIARRGAGRMRPIRQDEPSNADLERIEFFDPDRGTTRLTDIAGRRWWIYNYKIVTDGNGKRQWELVRDFMSPDIEFRFFMNALGRRQVYRFRNRREQRAYRVKHLDRQLAESVYVPDRRSPVFPMPSASVRATR